jgi:hypothetical protein
MTQKFIDGGVAFTTNKKLDESGFLHCKAIAAVPKEYEYKGRELHLDSATLDPNSTYKVYKTEDELKKSVDSYNDRPINFGKHLDEVFMTSNTNKADFAGHIKDSRYVDGKGVEVDFVINDKEVIDYLLSNKNVEVSPAYNAKLTFIDGKICQTNIKINSLTIMDATKGYEARGGSECRITDSKPKGETRMNEEEQKALVKLNTELENQVSSLKSQLAEKSQAFTDSRVSSAKTEEELKVLKTENENLKEKAVVIEKNAFVDGVKSKLDFGDCRTAVDCKRKILTDVKYLNVDFSKEDTSGINAFYKAFTDSKPKSPSSINNANNSMNESLTINSGFNASVSALEQAREQARARGGV